MRTPSIRLAIAGLALVALSACTLLGIPKAENFSEQLASGYTAVTTARAGGLALLQAHEITPDQMQEASGKLDQLRGALDLTDRVHQADKVAGEQKLARLISAIGEVQKCVDVGKPNFTGCIERVPIEEDAL